MLRSVLRAAPPPSPLRPASRSWSVRGPPEWVRHASASSSSPAVLKFRTERLVHSTPRAHGDHANIGPLRTTSPPCSIHAQVRGASSAYLLSITNHPRRIPGAPRLSVAGHVRAFHATRRNEISPIPFLAGLLKVSITPFTVFRAPREAAAVLLLPEIARLCVQPLLRIDVKSRKALCAKSVAVPGD
ncbi:hypothetical protein C8Q78DRAFT_786386 [Trametes maxima]|nr:hypothetical protein C8Q78DRAFT_786386 [Trametes maxima]